MFTQSLNLYFTVSKFFFIMVRKSECMTFVVCTLSKRDFLEQIVVELRKRKKKPNDEHHSLCHRVEVIMS